MRHLIRILLLVLSNALSSTRAAKLSNQYDITDAVNETIVGIFQTVELQNIAEAIRFVVNSDLVDFDTTPYKYDYPSIRNTIAKFYNIRITNASFNNAHATYEFFNNEMFAMKFSEFWVQLSGTKKLNRFETRENFTSDMHFSECTINTIQQTINANNSFIIDLQYDHLDITSTGEAAKWDVSPKYFQLILPSILKTFMNRNEKFSQTLGKIRNNLSTKHIIAKHPNFLSHKHLHYFIHNASIGSLNLRAIVVGGLWNLHRLDFTVGVDPNTPTCTLLIKDIRGNMILEDISRPTLSEELHYFADSLTISVTHKTKTINVQAENYYMVLPKTNTILTDAQSEIIMGRVERAIGSAIMPTMKYHSSKTSNSFPSEREIENIKQILTITQLQLHDESATEKSTYSELPSATAISLTNSANEYDITTDLNDTIVGIFQNFERTKVFELIEKTNRNVFHKGEYQPTTLDRIFDDLNISYQTDIDESRITYKYDDYTVQIHFPTRLAHIKGQIMSTFRIFHYQFTSRMRYSGYTITVVESKNTYALKPFYTIGYQYTNTEIEVEGEVLQSDIVTQYKGKIEKATPLILRDIMNDDDEKYWRKLAGYFDNQPTKNIISKNPYFRGHEQEYYYSIPKATFNSYHLRNIIINGLSNFKNLSLAKNPEVLTLVIENIRVSTNLEDSAILNSSLELNFYIDFMSISVSWDANRVHVEALNYSLFHTKTNAKLGDLYSTPIAECIESTIAASIFPSFTFQKTNRVSPFSSRSKMENSIRRLIIEKAFQPEERSTEKVYNTRILFDDNTVPTKLPQSAIMNQNHYHNSNYHLSFPNLTINFLIPENQSHPEQIQCPLFDTSQVSRRINVIPAGKQLRYNDKSNTIDVNFQISLPFLNVSVIKQNNSIENTSCEFRISNNQDIEIYSSAQQNNSTALNNKQLEMKKKIDKTLMSMTKERIVRTVKSTVCAPFNICKQSVKMVDEFIQRFVDQVLKKCSFRRKNHD